MWTWFNLRIWAMTDMASRCFKCVVTHPLASSQKEAKSTQFFSFNSGVIHPCCWTIISCRHVSGSPSQQINGCWRFYAYLFRRYFICLHLIILQNGGNANTRFTIPRLLAFGRKPQDSFFFCDHNYQQTDVFVPVYFQLNRQTRGAS